MCERVCVCVCVCEAYLHPPLPHKHREVLGSALPYPSLRRRMQAVCAVADHRRPCQRARTQPTAPQTRAHVPTRTRAHMLTHMLARASRPRCAARIPDFPPKGPGRRTGGISRLSAATCCAVLWHDLSRPTRELSRKEWALVQNVCLLHERFPVSRLSHERILLSRARHNWRAVS